MTETEKKNDQKAPRERSAAYPAIPLEEAVGYSTKLQEAFSKSPFSRENAVKEMGHQSVTGISGMKVSSLVHYGLLERDGNAYRNSELALRLAHRIDDNDFNEAVKLAAVTPKLYRALLGEFAGRAVPTALSSILVRNHKIGQKVADEVANTFRKTIEYAGLYQNGIVSSDLPVNGDARVDDSPPVQTGARSSQPIVRHPQTPAHIPPHNPTPASMLSVELPSGVVLSYPKHLAFAFSLGTFGKEIAALEEAVQKETKKHDPSDEKNDTAASE